MGNMGYCRFQNTLSDLNDCYDALCDARELSEDEQEARGRLVELCKQIAEEFGESD
jgi:hypothetical protein